MQKKVNVPGSVYRLENNHNPAESRLMWATRLVYISISPHLASGSITKSFPQKSARKQY